MKFTYLAICSQEANPGITKKIFDWLDAANELGYESNAIIIPPDGGINSYLRFNIEIMKSKEKILLLRNPTHLRFLLVFSILIARINKCKIIIDVPSPLYVLIKEILGRTNNFLKYIAAFEIFIFSSIPFIFANKIVQYSHENWWYNIGCTEKILMIGNGIKVDRIKLRKSYPTWPSNKLVLIGVANVALWHGYDRILYAISEFNKLQDTGYKVYFNIIGDGPELVNLKNIVVSCNLDEYVDFHGLVSDSNYIDNLYQDSHIGVSSLGLHRIGLEVASVLKSREYVATGIPFIFAGEDFDFVEENNFRFKVSNSDDVLEITELFKNFRQLIIPNPKEIRKYAVANLSVKKKLKNILNS